MKGNITDILAACMVISHQPWQWFGSFEISYLHMTVTQCVNGIFWIQIVGYGKWFIQFQILLTFIMCILYYADVNVYDKSRTDRMPDRSACSIVYSLKIKFMC